MRAMRTVLIVGLAAGLLSAGCGGSNGTQTVTQASAAPSLDAAFTALAGEYLQDLYKRSPSAATALGIHTYDSQLEDYSKGAVTDAVDAARRFRARVAAVDETKLNQVNRLDRDFLLHQIDARILSLDVIKPWARDPDSYSSGITGAVYIIIKRNYAPESDRLKQVIAREKLMPAALLEARKNLDDPPRILTDIAIEQIDGDQMLLRTAVPDAFAHVTDRALLDEFKTANDAVIAALGAYKTWLQKDLLPHAQGHFAIGEDAFRKKLAFEEMVDVPLDELLAIAQQDLERNKAAFAETAKQIDPNHTPLQVLATIEADHPPAAKLLDVTQQELDAIGRFMADRHIVTVPKAATARVQETPPFLRATTTASMDTPGPFEQVATEAYYNMTLPDPKATAAEKAEFMKQWYYAAISNVSVHEVWPGHYLQFLYAKSFPSDVRKVLGANTNIEGWAHYCEQMVLDEGFHDGDPKYRLAQIQDALLRDVRFIAGIKLHTRGMTVREAEDMFVNDGYQPRPIAVEESKRGTNDPTYGYYTMGKLMILKLRDDYKTKQGSQFSLQQFHDAFIALGPLPIPLIREAMLGSRGEPFAPPAR